MGTGCTRHTWAGKWINCTSPTGRRCGVGSCSRLWSESVLNEEQNLDLGSPAFDSETEYPSKQRKGARMPCSGPLTNLADLQASQLWYQTSSDKKDSWLKQMLLCAWCLLQVTSVFFHLTTCCTQVECFLDLTLLYCIWWKLPYKWAYWGLATFSTAKELSSFPKNWCSACASSFCCYPTMSSWVLAHSPHCWIILSSQPLCSGTWPGVVASRSSP